MKKKKILISLAGLVAVVAISTTITAYTLAGDGSSTPAQESLGTQEPAFDVGGPATFEPGPGQMSDDGSVFVDNPDGEDGATGGPAPGSQGTGIDKLPEPVDGKVPAIEPVIDPIEPAEGSGEVVTVTPPKEDVEDADDQAVRVGPGTGELIDPLLATGAEVKVTGEVISEGIFSVDGRVIEVNGESVQVMDYGDAAALEAEAAGISPDGSSVAHNGQASMILWVAPPHFFRTETAIVLYVGENPKVIEALTSVLGPQFAGR